MLDRQVRTQLSCHGVDRCATAALYWAPLARSAAHGNKVSSRSGDQVSNLRLLLRSLIAPRGPGPLAATPSTSPALLRRRRTTWPRSSPGLALRTADRLASSRIQTLGDGKFHTRAPH